MMRNRKLATAGFTLIEVLISLGLLSVGTLGVLSMQQATLYANRTSRRMAMAQYVADKVMQRVELDSLAWTRAGINVPELANRAFLGELANEQTTSGWFRPVSGNNVNDVITSADEDYYEYNAFDQFGKDVADEDDAKFCVHMRATWVERYSSARVDVRVIWLREDLSSSDDAVAGSYLADTDCADTNVTTLDPSAIPNMRQFRTSKIFRINQL